VITASMSTDESAKTKSGLGGNPGAGAAATKPELVGQLGRAFSNAFDSTKWRNEDDVKAEAAAKYPGDPAKDPQVKTDREAYEKSFKNPVGEDIKDVPGSNKKTADVSVAGSFMVQYASNHVNALVGGTAVLKSSRDVKISAKFKQKTQTSGEATVSK